MQSLKTPPVSEKEKRLPRSRAKKITVIVVGILLLSAIGVWIMLTSYPNFVLHNVVEPKLKQLVIDRLGKRYSLLFNSITLTGNKDTLILTGVRISDNGIPADGSLDSTENFGIATPLDRLATDTVIVAGLDYWKLILQKGLFADAITIHSPKIYLRPGSLPKFAENTSLFPSFLPAISSKIINIENAELIFSETEGLSTQPRSTVHVQKASIHFRNFFLDEATYKTSISTFFCKNAAFEAENISHADSLGVTDITVRSVQGDLIDSSMTVFSVQSTSPIEEIRRLDISRIDFAGLDWFGTLAGRGLHGRTVTVESPAITLVNVDDLHAHPSYRFSGSDLIPLPVLLPNVELKNVIVRNAKVSAVLPKEKNLSSIGKISMNLEEFQIDSTTAFSDISRFFSRSARYGVSTESSLKTAFGMLRIGPITGTESSVKVKNIRLDPTIKGIDRVSVREAEIAGLDIWKFLMRDGLFASSITIDRPDIFLSKELTPPLINVDSALDKDPLRYVREFKSYPLPGGIPNARFAKVKVSQGSIHGIHYFDDPNAESIHGDSLVGLELLLQNFSLNNNSWVANRGMLFSENASFRLGALVQHTEGAAYSYTEGGIRGDLRRKTLQIDSVVLHPLLSEENFGEAFNYRTERLTFFAPKINIAGVNYQKLLMGNGFFADSVTLKNWYFHIYGDRRSATKVRIENSPYPHQRFQKITMPLGIKRINLLDGDFTFRERWPDSTFPGRIPFDRVNLQIGPISNDKKLTTDSTPTTIVGSMRMMNKGEINFTLDYQLLNPQMRVDVLGDIGSIDAALFNEYLARTEPFTLTGNIRSAEVDIHVTGDLMTGFLVPVYDSLRVSFFRWDKFPPGLVSFLANALFMRTHNIPELDHPLHKGEISATIAKDVSLFWGLWLPLRNAIGSVVRIPEWVW
ncbi:MAG: hypothetical protein ABI778_09320 [Ignavibacteriota bacterium]